MTAHLPGLQLPTGAKVDIHVHISAELNITPYVARQRVNAFVIMEVSDHVRGGEPWLVVGERLCWCVPLVLGIPGHGCSEKFGEILVDATTGELLVENADIQRFRDAATRLAERSAL